jgi:short-subunit dehydrogenase
MTEFAAQYGPWALIAGGAQGIGEAYTRYAAARGLNVVVIDISREALDTLTPEIERQYGVACLGVELDLSRPDLLELVIEAVGDREIGLHRRNDTVDRRRELRASGHQRLSKHHGTG